MDKKPKNNIFLIQNGCHFYYIKNENVYKSKTWPREFVDIGFLHNE